MEMVASSANVELRALLAENNGAGGRGRLGEPPYLDEGVPGLGSPSRSTGSNLAPTGGGLENSLEFLKGE